MNVGVISRNLQIFNVDSLNGLVRQFQQNGKYNYSLSVHWDTSVLLTGQRFVQTGKLGVLFLSSAGRLV